MSNTIAVMTDMQMMHTNKSFSSFLPMFLFIKTNQGYGAVQ
ncbi:hypothetical protein [Flagellimonas sp.]